MLSSNFIFYSFRGVLDTKTNLKYNFILLINKYNIMLPLLYNKKFDYMFRLKLAIFKSF